MNKHPTTDELFAYPFGELAPARAREVFAHCRTCIECGDELATIIVLRSSAVSAGSGHRRGWQRFAVAASILIVLGAGFFLVGRLLSAGNDTLGTRAEAPIGPSDYGSLATRDTLPQEHLDFRFGVATPAATGQGRLREGVQAIVDERFDDAAQSLWRLYEERPSNHQTAVYLGIALYLGGDTSAETETLLRSANLPETLSRVGQWYLGNLLLARGEVQAARAVFEPLRGTDDRWGREAGISLQALERF